MSATNTTGLPVQAKTSELSVKTIVVASDLSSNASIALNWATELAESLGAEIVVAHAIETELPALAEAHGPIAEHIRRKLAMIEGGVKNKNVPMRGEFELGRPWEVISEIAKTARADFIVVGAHGTSKLSERVLGTVADRLIKTTSIPVLVYRQTKQPHRLRTVLVATDFSEEAALATSAAVRLLQGSAQSATMVLFHTIALDINYVDFDFPSTIPQYWDGEERVAGKRLETLAASLRNDRLQVEVKTFRGYPPDAILQEAERINADLIAIGTVGRKGLNRFLMGSVAERILHEAKCPVLTVRRPDADEPIRLSND
jgi:nucleotide-binding universal stress UspA family protein